MAALLQLSALTVSFPSASGPIAATCDVGLSLEPGEVLGLVGESGSGK